MKMPRIALVLGLGLAFTTTVADAQDIAVADPIANWSYTRHASTAAEGFLRGRADVIQSAGQTAYLNSLAAVNLQEAYRRRIENSKLYVRTYLENKEMIREYREKYASAPLTKEQLDRIAQNALPDRLTAEQYNRETGKITWPHILRTEEYRALRERIDELFASRTPENSGNGSPFQRRVDEFVDGMLVLLKSNIDSVSPSQYGNAKWFLLSLDYEAELPMTAKPASVPTDKTAQVENVE